MSTGLYIFFTVLYAVPLSFTVFKQANLGIVLMTVMISCFGTFLQFTFLLLIFGQIGLLVFFSIQIGTCLF